MSKNIKITLILFLLISIIFNPIKRVNAHSVELDPQSLISLPWMITNGNGEITINKSIVEYSLYYQAVQISNEDYLQIEKINSNGEIALDTLKKEYTKLKTEMDNLEEIYNKSKKAYEEGKEGEDVERLKIEYETAKQNYQDKYNDYKSKVDEYNKKVNELNGKIKDLTPTYLDNNWVQTVNNKFSIDVTQFSGKHSFAIWIKLVTSDGQTYYDEANYTISGTKETEISVKSISLDKSSLSIEEGYSYTLTAKIMPSNATNKSVIWSSDNEKIAKVENGKVTAISEGTATITAKTNDGGYTANCKVTVNKKTKKQNSDTTNDTTIAQGKLPKTGLTTVCIVSMIILLSVVGIICYKKIKYYNFK